MEKTDLNKLIDYLKIASSALDEASRLETEEGEFVINELYSKTLDAYPFSQSLDEVVADINNFIDKLLEARNEEV